MMTSQRFRFKPWMAALCFCLHTSIASAETYFVGIVPQFDVKTLHEIWRPILNVLERRTGHTFILKGSPDIPAFEKDFDLGVFDFAYMNPYHYTIADKYTAINRDQARKLFGILAVARDSSFQSPEDLQGMTIAFPAPNALGASLLMRAELAEKYGLQFTPKYVKTHSSVYLNVALGLVEAGGGVQKTFNQQTEDIQQRLRILHTTQKVEPHPFVAKKSLNPKLVQLVQQALLDMGQIQEEAALLANVPFKKIGAAQDSDYDGVRHLNLARYYVNPQ